MRIETYKCDVDDAGIQQGWTVRSFSDVDGEATRHACDKHVAELMVHLMFIDKCRWVTVDRRLAV